MCFRASGLFRAARSGRYGDGGESLFGCGRAGCGSAARVPLSSDAVPPRQLDSNLARIGRSGSIPTEIAAGIGDRLRPNGCASRIRRAATGRNSRAKRDTVPRGSRRCVRSSTLRALPAGRSAGRPPLHRRAGYNRRD